MLPSLETDRLGGLPIRHLVSAVILGILVWIFSLRCELLVQYRTELGGVEHNVIHGIQKVMLGQDLYEDPEQPPFDVIQYTPGYYLLCAAIGKLMGMNGDEARSIFLLSRTISLVLWLIAGVIVYRACRVGGAAVWSGFMATGITLCSAWEQSFSRMDALAMALTAATVLSFMRWFRDQRRSALIITGILGVTAILTKQSGVVIAAAPGLYLLFTAQWKALRTIVLAQLITLCIGLGGTFLLGTSEAFYQNVVLGLRNGFSWMMWDDLFAPATYKYFIGWHLLAGFVVIRGWRSDHAPSRFLAVAIPLSLGFALVSGLKYGSRLNYMHESLMLTFIGIAVLLPQLVKTNWKNAISWAFALHGCLFAAFRTNSVAAWYRVGEPDAMHEEQLRKDQAVHDLLVNELGLKPGDKVFITYREYLEHLLVGQSLLTQKDIVQYSRERLFDYTAFHRAMTDGTVRFVITDQASGAVTYLDSTYAGWEPIRELNGRTILGRRTNP
ncbi:MAG: glycosyltransferase family 39 protein [Flavobacteriales bacterium]|nr:glycosyltransferase family 39 protein [Flavobacteriales bacterium]